MDYEVFWYGLGLRKPSISDTTFALACFAVLYVASDKGGKLITDYSPFINNYGYNN